MSSCNAPSGQPAHAPRNSPEGSTAARGAVIATIAFLTLVDLFAAQAILPALTARYRTTPSTMGVAVNACTFGMAIGSLLVAPFGRRIGRRGGIVASLLVLAIPTALLAHAPDLAAFSVLRIVQGFCMATAFTLTLAHLGESYMSEAAAMASAAYITGNVASNLFGRLASAVLVDTAGLEWNFYAFAALNLLGAALCAFVIRSMRGHTTGVDETRRIAAPAEDRIGLVAACGVGFCILFAFIGTFSYVNFVLRRSPFSIGAMQIGLVYLVFLPSLVTTPLAGMVAARLGTANALLMSLATAIAGAGLLLSTSLTAVLTGLALAGVGTFMAQAIATGFVARTMGIDRGVASGLYLGSYFMGGLAGAAVLGAVFERAGWPACVAGVIAALSIAIAFSRAIAARERGHSQHSA